MNEPHHCSFCDSVTRSPNRSGAVIGAPEEFVCNLCWNAVPLSRFERGVQAGDLSNTEVVQVIARMLNSVYKETPDA